MGGAPSMIYSGAVGEVGGMMVNSTVSSITSGLEMQEGLNVTLYSLQQEVNKFQCAIETARGRRLTSNNQKLLEWLARIIYAAYLGDYYLRTFKRQTSLPPMIGSPQGMSNLPSDNCPTNRATKRQRTIRTFLFGNDEHREVHDVLKMLRSFDMVSFLLMVNAQPERPMKRYLYMEPTTRLIYRAKEREQVMKFLFEPNMAAENNVDILPIVGSTGAGKTTLALHCLYDAKVQNHFSLKIYISWSHIGYAAHANNGPPRIFINILKQLNCTEIRNFDENTLLAMLKQNLSSEKFLIVMDSVSSHLDSTVWNTLLGCLRCGKQGSKIIFTCHLLSVYNKIKNHETWKPIMLNGFPEDEYRLFFMEHAFGSADSEDFPDLAKLGGEIAYNLNGSIWGAKIIGELLRDNLNAPFWSIFSQVDFLSSKDIWPVMKTISQLLPKRLCLKGMGMTVGEEQEVLAECNRVKSFRELMVLGPKYCTPDIKHELFGDQDVLEFLVTKHFDLRESYAFFALCIEPPIGGFDDQ